MTGISIGIVACTVFAVTAPAQAVLTLPDVLDRMETAQNNLHDVQFSFEQKIQQGDLPEQRITGEAWVMRPHRMRVLQKTPGKQVLTTDGTTFWLYTPAQQQVLKGSWTGWLKRSGFPLPLLDFVGTFTPDHWRSQYKVYFGGYNARVYELRFKPLKTGMQPVTLWISEDTFLPARGEQRGENYHVYVTLKSVRSNTGLKESQFSPAVPAGTEEIPVTF